MSGALTVPQPAAAIIRRGVTEPCRPWPRHVLSAESWRHLAQTLEHDRSLSLLALWADVHEVHALFADAATGGSEVLFASVAVERGLYQALSPARPAAAWFERMIYDIWGHTAADGRDARGWLDHGRWPHSQPMSARPVPQGTPQAPEFLPVEGADLHQVPLGPIHGGITEAGHFRFTCAGETVVRLEARLGYTHKGTLSLLRGKSPRAAARFAARLSGDSTVAHSLAFARAAEAALGVAAPLRADALRGVMAELERIANHLGDIAAICNDAGSSWLNARLGWHREAMLRACGAAFGHRLMMDVVVPGGVSAELTPESTGLLHAALDGLEAELPQLRRGHDGDGSLADRLQAIGMVDTSWAEAFAAGGIVGRASGRAADLRRAPGYPPYLAVPPETTVLAEGDVEARLRLRWAELADSLRLANVFLDTLPPGPLTTSLPPGTGEGIGWAESFRGDAWHWLRLEGGLITGAFLRDPSWLHWPLLEAAMRDTAISEFSLVSRSINGSISGVDL